MKKNRFAFIPLFVLSIFLFACGQSPEADGPHIDLTLERVPENGITVMHGSGFTPLSTVESHLKRPNDTEFNPLLFYTDENGEFEHDIESFLLMKGVHEVWVIDIKTGVKSNVAKFETTTDQIPVAQ